MLKRLNFWSAIMAGIAATGTMTLLMYAAPLMGLPSMDIMYALGGLFPWQISPYIPGAIVHGGIGSALALLYALIFARMLPGPRWIRGALYSLLPWLLAVYAMGPMMALAQSWTTPAVAAQVMNPCGVVNPCGAGTRPTNPCAVRPAALNPCSPVRPQVANPCTPQTSQAMNPCAPQKAQAVNPCGATTAPGHSASSLVVTRLTSLMAHLLFGVILGLLYRPKADGAADQQSASLAARNRDVPGETETSSYESVQV